MSELKNLLLQQMVNGNLPNTDQMSRMLAEHEDPRVRLLAQFMNKETDVATDVEYDQKQTPTFQPIEVEPPRDAIALQRLRRKFRRLVAELHQAQFIGDTLSAALGACYLCWGEDPRCENCRGAGRSGWCEPNGELFAAYISPALERLREASQVLDSTRPAERSHFTEPRVCNGMNNRRKP